VPRAIIHPSCKVSPREVTPESLSKARIFGKNMIELKTDSEPSANESIVSASLKLSIEQARPKFSQAKRLNLSKEHPSNLSFPPSSNIPTAETHQLSFSAVKATTVPTNSLSFEVSSGSKPASTRNTSKIPTPLSRKSQVKSSSTSSDCISNSSTLSAVALKASSSKMHSTNNKSSTSQISCSIPRTSETVFSACATIESSSVTPQVNSAELFALPFTSSRLSATSARENHEETLLPAERRRTVVEVCEKVVVSQGKTPTVPAVTPFITVSRVNADKQSSVTEIRNDQRISNVSRKS